MNSITLDELNRIVPILGANNVGQNELFDYFRIVSINNTKYEDYAQNPLYFLSYNTEKEVNRGWFQKRFDLRTCANEVISKHPNATFVIEENMVDDIKDKNVKFIIVNSISETIDKLFEFTKNKNKAKIISVTGSVGKTTCVGLIESLLKQKYNVLRIYSKRITPIILKANIINFLNENIDYIVLENSIYYHEHVKVLSDLLKPDIACMLNIESSHLGIDILDTLDDICIYKSYIMKNAKYGIINGSDSHLAGLDLEDGSITYNGDLLFDTELLQLDKVDMDNTLVEEESFIINNEVKVKPFLLSNLSKIQFTIAYKVGKLLGLTKEQIEKGMNEYQPVENRINTQEAFGKKIIFDGDITTYERMKELSNTNYKEQYLVIRKVGSSENTYRIANIGEHFKNFKKVFLFDDIEYLEELKEYPNVEIVSNHDFMSDLDGQIIYHYSGYYRVWNKFESENLNTYDKEKYPIKKVKVVKMKKILLLHGWNYRNYTNMTKEKDAWHNRKKFVEELSKKFEVYKINFPGFCGESEPNKAWDLKDFANYVHEYLENNNLTVDYILGYSFGGAVAVEYNRIFDENQKIILISPAIVRNHDKSKKFIETPDFLNPIRNFIRDLYLVHIVKTNEMVHGSKFLRESYQNIVRIELIEELEKIDPSKVKIIYGSKDKMVNPTFVIETLKQEYKNCISVIDGGEHDIANSHPEEIIQLIKMGR